jgi:hypothetical protein
MMAIRGKYGFLALLVLGVTIFWDQAASGQSPNQVTCADLAGRWTGVHEFSAFEKYDLTIVVKPDCSYDWKGRQQNTGRFEIDNATISYRNVTGSNGPVTITVVDGRKVMKLTPKHGRYTATATKVG